MKRCSIRDKNRPWHKQTTKRKKKKHHPKPNSHRSHSSRRKQSKMRRNQLDVIHIIDLWQDFCWHIPSRPSDCLKASSSSYSWTCVSGQHLCPRCFRFWAAVVGWGCCSSSWSSGSGAWRVSYRLWNHWQPCSWSPHRCQVRTWRGISVSICFEGYSDMCICCFLSLLTP